MSSKPPSKAPPRDQEPPGLSSDLAERPEVKALLKEIQKKLKPGEDPLYYALPEELPNPATRLPDEARVYVAPTPLSAPAKPRTLDMQRVRVSAGVNPRASVTQRIERAAEADAIALVRPEAVLESRRGALYWWGVVATVSLAVAGASAVVIIKGMRLQPAVAGNGAAACASGSAAAPQASAEERSDAAAKPSASAAASAVAVPAKGAGARAHRRRRVEDDPYAAAPAVMKSAAPVAPPTEPAPPPFVEETPEF